MIRHVDALERRALLAADLPRYATPDELARAPVADLGAPHAVTAAPAAVESVAEHEAMEGLVVSWSGSAAWRTILAQIARRVTVEGGDRMYVGYSPASYTPAGINSTLTNNGVNLSNVTLFPVALNSIWARDYGPRYVYEAGRVRVIADHEYNRPRPLDDDQPIAFGALKQHQVYDMGVGATPLVHGGGNYHLDSDGDAYATDLVVDENPSLSAQQIVNVWQQYQGNATTITGEFPLSIDATGHIDMWMQIYGPRQVFISDWPNNVGSVQDNICDQTATLMAGRGYQVTRLPAYSVGGTHYTFANMVVCNDVVLLPQYNNGPGAAVSASVAATVQSAFASAGRTVYPINADPIVTAAGVFHCVVQHVPAHRGAAGPFGGLAPTAVLQAGVAPGSTVLAGETVTVRWVSDDDAATGGARVDVRLSTDGGATYPTLLAGDRPALGSFDWTVPAGVNTSAARLQIVARDALGNTGADASAASFTVGVPGPSAAPGAPDLVAASDTGVSAADNVTRRNNVALLGPLSFDVPNTTAGSTVNLYADGALIGSAVAGGATTTVTGNGTTVLADGARVFTARQVEPGRPESADSPALAVTVDTVAPTYAASFAFETEQRVDVLPSELAFLNNPTLKNLATGEFLTAAELTVTANNATQSVRRTDGAPPLSDGDWQLSAALYDTAGNGPPAAEHAFFVLAGDANRDRAVTFADLSVAAANYGATGRTFSQGNFDYDAAGSVGFADLSVLAVRYGTALPAPRPAALTRGGERVARDVLA